ncbi:hydrogenase small subunit [uncultured Thiocystis sp.]|jgi:hydrogenase small subunit|uniref:hydrogenase small subunit n=1 Tax=uncultured Thiocystis sp. TaxID=1202134 RepID=UPI0025CE48A5|nr:hydrogenase small subunit [uncultured Thiocystis sp.]
MTTGLHKPSAWAQEQARTDGEIMLDDATAKRLLELGISRRRFLSFCAGMASLMALPQAMVPQLAAAATARTRPSVVYLSFQECTGCLESMVNSFAFRGGTTLDNLILNLISLDYQETLMAAAGEQAEEQLRTVTQKSGYVLVVDGSIPAQWDNGYFISGERSGVARFRDAAKNARLILAVGTCASFGGLPKAAPNPTGAVSIQTLMRNLGISKPLINLSGCPPIPEVTTGVILYYLARGMPDLDDLRRPSMFYGETVHDECYREESYEDGPLARSFDDAAARRGGCLIKLGCKGPVTHNACATIKWNQGTSFPMMSGHGCIGCSEPDFWDRLDLNGQKGFYVPLANGEGEDEGEDEDEDEDEGESDERQEAKGEREADDHEQERDDDEHDD